MFKELFDNLGSMLSTFSQSFIQEYIFKSHVCTQNMKPQLAAC